MSVFFKPQEGELRDVVIIKAVFFDDKGDVRGLISVIRDITRRKKDAVELKKREQMLSEMGHIAKIGGWEHDLLNKTVTWTKEIFKIMEIDETDSIPGPDEHMNYYPIEDRIKLREAYAKAINTGKHFDMEVQVTTTKGKEIWGHVIGSPEFRDGKCVKMRGIFQDITEKKKMEAMVLQGQKMESIGNLAGGVAHDYNNMLNVIIGYTEMALEKVKEQDPIYSSLCEILKAAKRSSDITRQLLAFARKQIITPKIVDLNHTVENTLKMIQRLIGEDIDLSWKPGSGELLINIDPAQVDQILANLCVNARDAIRNVGKITIETALDCFDKEYCSHHPGFIPGDYVMLAVSDDGIGMSPEILEKIFDPYFTTKEFGKGTGLGLSTVYGIVKQNNGFINVYSEPEKGTTFKVYISRHAGQSVEILTEKSLDIQYGRGETILVVEDNTSILKLAKKLLEDLGYIVFTASTPSEAIRLAKEHTAEIHLLITDVVMPEMNGSALSEKLRKTCPSLKTLYMSGYTANVIAHRGVLDEGIFFLPKPFSKRDIALKVREVLSTSP